MASQMRVLVPLVFLLVASILATGTQASLSCDTVSANLSPCHSYVSGSGELPECCNGLRDLKGEANNPPDRQTACYCVKAYLAQTYSPTLKIYAALPDVCSVDLTYKLDLSLDCNSA